MTNPDRDELVKLADRLERFQRILEGARKHENNNLSVWSTDAPLISDAATALRRLASSEGGGVKGEPEPVAWVIPGDDNARDNGAIDAMAWEEGEFTKPLYTAQPADAGMRVALERIAAVQGDDAAPWMRSVAAAALTAPGATTKSDGGYDVRFHENVLDRLGAEKIKPGPSNLNFTPISGPAMDDLERRKECDDGPSEAQVTADARCFLGLPPSEPSSDGVDTCIACDVPLVDGDMVYSDASGGCIHAACCGPERESYVGNDGEPLKDGEPIPTPWPWTADPSSTRSEVTVPCGLDRPSASQCPNMKEVGGGMDGERYSCAVCGKGYYLDYDDMR